MHYYYKMGNSSSSVSQDIQNNILNETTLKSLNKQAMNVATDVLVESAKSCSSSVTQSNDCAFQNMTSGGDINIGGDQSNKAKVSFSCVNSDKVESEMASAMMQKVMSEVKALNGTEAAAKLEAAAAAKKESGFLAIPTGSSNSDVNTKVSTNIQNKTAVSVENILEQNLKSNFTSKTVSECIGKTTQTNKLSASDINAKGNINAKCIQTNSLESVQECKQLNDAITKTLNQTAQDLGLKVATESSTKTETKAEAKAESSNISRGLDDLASSLTGLLALVGLEAFGPLIGICCLICCCLCCILIAVAMSGVLSSGSDSPSFDTNSMSMPSDISSMSLPSNMFGGNYLFSESIRYY